MLTLTSSTLPIIIDLGTYIHCSEGVFIGTALDWDLMGNTLLIDYHNMQFSLAYELMPVYGFLFQG